MSSKNIILAEEVHNKAIKQIIFEADISEEDEEENDQPNDVNYG